MLDAPELQNEEGHSVEEQARHWEIALQQTENVAKLAGKLPAGALRTFESSKSSNPKRSRAKAHEQHTDSRPGGTVASRHARKANPNGLKPLLPNEILRETLASVVRTPFPSSRTITAASIT